MKLKMWQVDAFASKVLEGNPAAIVPLERWLDTALMQKIANENNLAETAFIVRTGDGCYDLRWFTPTMEIWLCGHATLASAWTIFEHIDPNLQQVSFSTQSGILTVDRRPDGRNVMSMPTIPGHVLDNPALANGIANALSLPVPREIFDADNIVAVFDNPADIRKLAGPGRIAEAIPTDKGLIVTAPGDEGYDFISRYFAPHHGIPEDPVTGSAHCALTPYWSRRLGKKTLKARQVSPRGGDLTCTDAGERTILSGPCALYMTAEIEV